MDDKEENDEQQTNQNKKTRKDGITQNGKDEK